MSEFLVPMKSKNAEQNNSSSPHSSSSGLSSKGLTTTAEVPNKETDNFLTFQMVQRVNLKSMATNILENFQLSYVLVMAPARYQEFLRLKKAWTP